jgi:acyl-CoA reductase-like NAD-dependent aldehyde dehydrogenase
MEYDHIDDVIEFINSRPRPLALYYFDFDQARADYVAERTHSGILVKNGDHVAQDDFHLVALVHQVWGNIMVQKVSSAVS